MNLPAEIKQGKYPETYQTARNALAKCEKIDECKAWADKAEALKSYAKQIKDDELMNMCQRIKLRAMERAGQLLEELDRPEHIGRPRKNAVGAHTISKKKAAKEAGLSDQQQRDATNIARAPDADKEIEKTPPPTVAALAEQGKQKQPAKMHCRDTIAFMGVSERICNDLQRISLNNVINNANDVELNYILERMALFMPMLDAMFRKIKEKSLESTN